MTRGDRVYWTFIVVSWLLIIFYLPYLIEDVREHWPEPCGKYVEHCANRPEHP